MIEPDLTDSAILEELGERLRNFRLDLNFSQTELAREAKISLNTIIRMESGLSTQLSNLLKVLRALDQLPILEILVPLHYSEDQISKEQKSAEGLKEESKGKIRRPLQSVERARGCVASLTPATCRQTVKG